MNIAICDDEVLFREDLEKHLRNYYNRKSLVLKIVTFSCGEDLLESDVDFDLIFLDVEMDGKNGIDIGKEIKIKNPHSIVFIITSHEKYLDDAFRIHAFRFLSKPLNVLRLYKALDDVKELISNEIIAMYDIKTGRDVKIYTNDIIYIEIEKKKLRITTVDDIYYSSDKLSVWKEKLNGISFVCPHSSYIANLNYAVLHTRTELVLAKRDRDGKIIEKYSINIAPKKQAEIKRQFFYVLERG